MSSSSEVSSLMTLSRPAALMRKSSIALNVHDHYSSKIYTSGSPISGEAIITPWKDTRFDQLEIIFVGITRTRLEAIQVPQRASHTFLKLSMPISESSYPVPRMFEAGQAYTIPFNFVVPDYLTISACKHATQSDQVQDHHMRLPPTMGFWERDDMSPETAQVEYAVKARVLRHPSEVEEYKPLKLFEAQQLISVLPATPEDPPLNVEANNKLYTMSKSKSIRKNLFSGKIGKVTASALQPAAVQLETDGYRASETAVTVNLAFQPSASEASPPNVNAVSAKIVSTTFYSASPMTKLPDLTSRSDLPTHSQLAYSTTVPVFNTTVEKTTWRKQVAAAARRDSGYSSDGQEVEGSRSKSKKSSSAISHTATLYIPFKIPVSRKLFLPTFHSCITSRVYVLHLTLSVGAGNTSISLDLPIQMAVAPSEHLQDQSGLPSFESVLAERDADDHLRPRLMQVPALELQQTSLLPGYDDLDMRRPIVRTVMGSHSIGILV